jgi:hypothetical protein
MLKFLFALGGLLAMTAPLSAQEATFKCPDAGTRVERTDAPALTFRGASTSNPLICVDALGQERFLGYWRAADGFFRAGKDTLLRNFTSGAGGVSTINYFGSNRVAESIYINENWQILGPERVSVIAGSFEALKVQRQYWITGTNYRFTETVWFDRATGAPVKSTVDHRNAIMSSDVISWQATEVLTRRAGS